MHAPRTSTLLSAGNTCRLTRAARPTLAIACGSALLAVLLGPVASASADVEPPIPELAAMPIAEPTPAQALATLSRVRRMLTNWGGPITKIGQPVGGIAVVLRFQGQVVGRGSALALPGQTVDALNAITQAMSEAERRVPIRLDGLPDEERLAKLRLIAPEVTISVEIASPLTILTANTFDEVEGEAPWMLAGLAARLGTGAADRIEGTFPSAMQIANTGPADGLKQAISRVTEQPALALIEPDELRRKHAVSLYRFSVQHAAEPAPDAPAEVLYRAQRLIGQAQIDEARELRRLADTMADHLARGISAGLVPVGTQPIGAGDAEAATPRQAAGVALALVRYAARREGTGESAPPESLVPRALQAARVAGEWAASQREVKADPAACAMIALALGDDTPAPIKQVVAEAFTSGAFDISVPGNARGLLALAQPTPALRQAATRAAFEGQTPATIIAMMPWLGWAELQSDGPVPALSALRQMRAQVWQNQLSAIDAGANQQDLVGGILFPGSRQPLPSWQTARATAALATMLADDRLTSTAERGPEIARLLNAGRFLRQLQVDRTLVWLAAEPRATLGGIRPSPFDQRTSAEATSMTLLATVELIASVDKLSAK